MLTLPITKQAKQQEWKIILAIAQNNWFPLHIIHNLKKKLISKKQRQKLPTTTTQQAKKWVTFSYHSPLILKKTNLFKHSNFNIALCATNTIHRQLTDKIVTTSTNSSGTYKLKCNTCNISYIRVGHSDRPIAANALHILNNRYEYGTAEETLELLKPCKQGNKNELLGSSLHASLSPT